MSGQGGAGRRRWNYARSFRETDAGDMVEVWNDAEKRAPMHLAIVWKKGRAEELVLEFRLYHERKLPWLTINQHGYSWRWRILKKKVANPID
jgi:hypothetical protein